MAEHLRRSGRTVSEAPSPSTNAKRLDLRGAITLLVVGVPLATAALVALRPALESRGGNEFGSLVGLAAAPLAMVLMVAVWFAYRWFLNIQVVNARGTAVVRTADTTLGWVARVMPLLVPVFVPLVLAPSLVATGAIAAVCCSTCLVVIERRRRRSRLPREDALRWFDDALKAYRLRWDALGLAIVAVAVGLGVSIREHSLNAALSIGGIGLVVLAIAPYFVVYLAFENDSKLTPAARVRAALSVAIVIVPYVLGRWTDSPTATILSGVLASAAFVADAERQRRSAVAVHLKRLIADGHGSQVARFYPYHVARAET
jgi:hypothetical protein